MEGQVIEQSAAAVIDEPVAQAAPAQEAAPAAPTGSPSIGARGVQFDTLDDMWKFANFAFKAGWSPKKATPESNVVAMQFGAELGVGAMQSIQSITPINGRPCAWGDLPLGLCMSSPYFDHAEFKEWYTGEPGADDYTAHCQARRVGGNVAEVTFSTVDAKRAGLWEGAHQVGERQKPKDTIWYKYYKRMLKYRARAFCLRDVFPDVLKGLHTGEEMSDVEQIMSRLDLGKRSTPPTTEPAADLRENLTDKTKVAAKAKKAAKPKAEPEPPASEPPAATEEKPEDLHAELRNMWQRIPPTLYAGLLAGLGIAAYSDIFKITDIKELMSIRDAFGSEVPADNA